MTLGVTRKDLVMVAVLLVGVLLAVLNQTFLSPALPTIMADVGVDATTAQWLTSGYALVEAVVIPLSAYLIGRFSTRQLFITAFALFTVGSLSAALAPNFWVLLLGRVLQATCTGMAMPMVFTVILLVFPREKRGTAMGVIGLIIGFAPAVGPSVAGLLVDSVGWRALFAVVTGLSVAVILLAVFVLKNYGNFTRAPFDALSVALSTVGLVCLLYGLSTFAHSENLVITFALMAFGLVVCGLYVRRQTKLPVPMLHVDILRTRKYAITVVVIVIIQAALMGCEVITPLYIQGVLGNSASVSGFAMLPGAVIGAVMGLLSGRLFDRYGLRKVVIPGIIVAVLGASGLARLGIDSPIIAVTLTYTTLAIGLQFTMTPLNTWGVNSLSNSMIHHAESVSNTLNQVAASVGTAVLVSVSAMAPGLYPEASGLEQMYLGDHMAYTTTFAIMVLAALIVIFVAREKKGARRFAARLQCWLRRRDGGRHCRRAARPRQLCGVGCDEPSAGGGERCRYHGDGDSPDGRPGDWWLAGGERGRGPGGFCHRRRCGVVSGTHRDFAGGLVAEYLPIRRRRDVGFAVAGFAGSERYGGGHPSGDFREARHAGGRGVRPVRQQAH